MSLRASHGWPHCDRIGIQSDNESASRLKLAHVQGSLPKTEQRGMWWSEDGYMVFGVIGIELTVLNIYAS